MGMSPNFVFNIKLIKQINELLFPQEFPPVFLMISGGMEVN